MSVSFDTIADVTSHMNILICHIITVKASIIEMLTNLLPTSTDKLLHASLFKTNPNGTELLLITMGFKQSQNKCWNGYYTWAEYLIKSAKALKGRIVVHKAVPMPFSSRCLARPMAWVSGSLASFHAWKASHDMPSCWSSHCNTKSAK